MKSDRRLIGTWRSDRRRTLKDWIYRPGKNTPKRRKFLNNLFGHLVLRYTLARCYSRFKGNQDFAKYEVIGTDSDSVAIMSWNSLLEERRILHINFEGNHYWISIGRQREWFKKIASKVSRK